MTPDEVLAATVALARRVGLDRRDLPDRLERTDPRALLVDELGAATSLLPEDPRPALRAAATELEAWSNRGLRLVTVIDDEYPHALRGVHDRPALLFVAGDLALAGDPRGIAVVGTRRPTVDGIAAAQTIAAGIARAGHPVISGLAAGIDAVAHRAAVAAGGRTVAVLGTGLERAYPPENAELQHELARSQAVVSACWPDDGPTADRLRRRNGVISGLGLGSVIVEASPRSGTRVLARLALAHGRPVFLRRALLTQGWAAELARRPGVHVIDGVDEVLEVVRRTSLDRGPLVAAPDLGDATEPEA